MLTLKKATKVLKPLKGFLYGPTASGKTALACELYERGNFELISVDSALVYKDMDIGTAKPTKEELSKIKHHLMDYLDPLENFSVADYQRIVRTKTIKK